uniref:Uncharacterized protein n=1 Tax=Esox lucius TaxID=8010 RepID=A0AAY5JXK6_ESOLU
MDQQEVLLDQDQLCCSVCLDLLKEPVTIPCGHSYCLSCIEGYWDQDDLKGVYSCPQCRQTFTPRPILRKNNMLAEVVEKLKTGLQTASPVLCCAGPGDVVCDFCTGTRKQKALMSCLVCLASYCESHLQPHYESSAFKKHKLIKATTQLQEKICSHHDKLLEVFCRTDQQCICLLCSLGEHKGHDTVSATAERTEKQRQLGISQQKVHQRVQEREKEVKEVQQAMESLKLLESHPCKSWATCRHLLYLRTAQPCSIKCSCPLYLRTDQPCSIKCSCPFYLRTDQPCSIKCSCPFYLRTDQPCSIKCSCPFYFRTDQPCSIKCSCPFYLRTDQPCSIKCSCPLYLRTDKPCSIKCSCPLYLRTDQPCSIKCSCPLYLRTDQPCSIKCSCPFYLRTAR